MVLTLAEGHCRESLPERESGSLLSVCDGRISLVKQLRFQSGTTLVKVWLFCVA